MHLIIGNLTRGEEQSFAVLNMLPFEVTFAA